MNPNQKLAITIPTYNRANFLDYSLNIHVPILREQGIQIFISDNASTDNTKEIVEKWQKEYPLIHYFRNADNFGFDRNFELALKYPDTEYVWLLGDTYILPNDGIKIVLDSDAKIDVFVFNLANKNDTPSKRYYDCNNVLADLAGIMSCVSCNVFSKRVVSAGDSIRYHDSNFLHTGIIFEYIGQHKFTLLWVTEISISGVKLQTGKTSWSSTTNVLKIGVEGWVNFVFSLPVSYTLNSKLLALRTFGLLTWKGVLILRANGLLSINSIHQYSAPLSLTLGWKKYLLYLTLFIPSPLIHQLRKFSSYLQKILQHKDR